MKYIVKIVLLFYSFASFSQQRNAEVIYYETKIIIKNGVLNKKEYFEIKINNRAGEQLTKIAIPYSKMVKISNVEGQIKDKEGKVIRKLSKSEIKDRNAISNYSFYEDNYIKEFILKHNEYPYYIEYSYELQQKEFLYIDFWVPLIDAGIPTIKAKLTVQTPHNYPISAFNQFVDEVIIDSSSTGIIYNWNASYLNVIDNEIFSPSIENLIPKVLIVPNEFKFELIGTFENWQTYGNWQYRLNQGLSDLPTKEKEKVNSLIKGIEDKRDIAKKLYYYLQDQTRYVNITIETGGLKPYSAIYVSENKYGDCKALTNYLKSLYEFVGIPSFYTKVYAGEPNKQIIKEFPSQQFNHVILCVPIEKDTIWLDCTSDGPFNYLGTFTQNRDVLIVDDRKSFFSKTPALQPNDVCEIRKVMFNFGESKEIIANFDINYKGNKYEKLFYLSNSLNETQRNQIIRDNYIENGYELIDYKIINNHKDSASINLIYNAKSDKILAEYRKEIIFSVLPFKIPDFEDIKNRQCPVQIDYPINMIDIIEFDLQKDYEILTSFNNQSIRNKYGSYDINYTLQNEKIKVTKCFILNAGEYSIEEYSSFYNFIERIKELELNNKIILNK